MHVESKEEEGQEMKRRIQVMRWCGTQRDSMESRVHGLMSQEKTIDGRARLTYTRLALRGRAAQRFSKNSEARWSTRPIDC